MSKENSRTSLQHVVAHLRAFLRYGADQSVVPVGLDVIDMPRVYRDELPPRALDWATVRRLLASVRRRSPREWRDYAVLHLLAYYGLRPAEVAALRVDSIDWNAGTLRVEQRKTLSTLVLPLAARTVRILRCYLRSGRLSSNLQQLFLRVRSPIQALKHYGIIDIFNFRVAQSGLDLGGASSYALRHAFAMRLLRRGVGLKALVARRLGALSRGLYVAPAYLANAAAPGSPYDLARHMCVRLRAGDAARSLRLVPQASAGGEAVSVELEGRFVAGSMSMVRELVLRGAGIGIIDKLFVREDVAQGRLVPVLPDWTLPDAPVHLLTVSRFVPARVRAFADLVAARLGRGLEGAAMQPVA